MTSPATSRVQKWISVVGVAVGGIVIYSVFAKGVLRDRIDVVYEKPPPGEMLAKSKIRFEEVASQLGIASRNRPYFPNPLTKSDRLRTLSAIFPSVAVADVNGDGFMDIYISSASPKPNELYINQHGSGFLNLADRYGVGDINREFASGPALFADFDGDGKLDLFVSKWGAHRLFKGDGPERAFVDKSERLGNYFSNPDGVNAFDYNKDGRLDIVVGNFLPAFDLRKKLPSFFIWGTRNDKVHGGRNHLLENTPAGFRVAREIDFKYDNFTHAIGILDVNRDGWPDLFVADDYATDEMWLNVEGRDFRDITNGMIPLRLHGMAGMNAEIIDLFEDGLPSIYVTNIFKPPFANSGNLLWRQTPGGHFKQVSKDLGINRCGFSWGAKFADFDLDGDLDLIVVNGRAKSQRIKSPKEGRSYWHERTVIGQTPLFLREFYGQKGRMGSKRVYVSSFERSCVFEQRDGKFYDVAEHAGVVDIEDGKGLALIDFDNDGRMDFVVVNVGGPALLYHNISTPVGQWLGFQLLKENGDQIPVGARVTLNRSNGAPLIRDLYPANGYHAQSDPRVLFGLAPDARPLSLNVRWPDGHSEVFEDLKVNAYQNIVQGKGREP